ncbi:MAG: 4Fe-4S cluster-binding domain-containing protein [Bacteroidales bacterium]|jgi:organic radical activating enzyme|nr:4Fe-4S cluster-binding domain-containing protein [Bacteroidales bacterium]
MRYFSDRYRKPFLTYLYVPVTLECNRNCKGCVCYSPLAGSETRVTLEQFERAIKRITEITGTETIQQVDISGGEPLLHPDILKFIEISRSIFTQDIVIRTNGLLLSYFIENNWKFIQTHRIKFEISEYPDVPIDKIMSLAKHYKITCWNHWGKTDFKFRKMGISIKPNYLEMNEEWDKCCDTNCCNTLRIIGDKAYFTGCSTPVFLDILDNYFGTSYEKLIRKGDRIDIYDPTITLDDFLKFHQPIPMCAYCRRRTGVWFNLEKSEKNKNEWIAKY